MWYFSESELKESPSFQDGISQQTIDVYRFKGCELIDRLAAVFRLPKMSVASAKVFFHRFFVVQSFKRQDAWLIAATCLFLAAKVEEHYMKAVDFSKHYLAYRRKLCHDAKKVEGGSRVYPSEPATSPTVEAMTDELLFTECLVLHVLAYDLGVVHPHAYVNEFVSLSMAHVDASEDMAVELKRAAWSFLNDSSNTCLCLRFEPRVITAVAVYLAGLYLSHWTQPLTGSGPQTWWASVAIPVDVLEGMVIWSLVPIVHEVALSNGCIL
ncbi:hypothetical protein, variant 1 [Aphanomyces astaci]|uniref:Cyclin-like domain-containing protein n=1 Tax=Aphanomyces astaci TaxID=112090 RepID=W4H7R1_APHAT|nr:hypothetical protein, variant 1 [Aphanomyces astaci]ETV87591.1 hypothetical protein, variant 1 [Aphanomyces astaci]|eukprot:XP_009822454.1 hypothetical protein, variant 1 [Aphanomyces astaci]